MEVGLAACACLRRLPLAVAVTSFSVLAGPPAEGPRGGGGGGVPAIIWSFWDDCAQLPKAARLALASWQTFAPEYEVRFLDAQNWTAYAKVEEGPGPAVSAATGDCRFADWLRLALLAEHGGVWIDATLVLTAPLRFFVNSTAELSGVHLDGMLFETYFVAAPKASTMARRWLGEFEKISNMDDDAYEAHLVALKSRGIEPLNGQFVNCDWADQSWLHAMAHRSLHWIVALANAFVRLSGRYVHPCGELFWLRYLRTTVALNTVLATSGEDPRPLWNRFGVSVQDTSTTLSAVHFLHAFDTEQIVRFLATSASAGYDLEVTGGIKLRSKERLALERLVHCEEGSALCRIQAAVGVGLFVVRRAAAPEPGAEGPAGLEL